LLSVNPNRCSHKTFPSSALLDFLRDYLVDDSKHRVICFSGRGGEYRRLDGSWTIVSCEDIKRRFKAGEAEILLCTDTASEGLNFHYCGALVNYDMPWNPMKVEQRIGRIDRLQPILSKLSRLIADVSLSDGADCERRLSELENTIYEDILGQEYASFDIDEAGDEVFELRVRAKPAYDLKYLHTVIEDKELLPPGHEN